MIAGLLILGACSGSETASKMMAYDVEEPAPINAPGVKGPQIAYSYIVGYRLDATQVAPVQARHTALCRDLGASRCLVLNSTIDNGDKSETSASISLVVDARLAPTFGKRLDAAVSGAGGSVGSRRSDAEDITKQAIDTDARLRAKEALAERLLTLIRTANGRVGDLVAAEKAYADTQEELAATRSLQASLRQRVAMSRYDINYASSEATGALSPILRAVSSAGETIGTSLGALFTFVLMALPWALTVAAVVWLFRRLGIRGPIAWWRARRAAHRLRAD